MQAIIVVLALAVTIYRNGDLKLPIKELTTLSGAVNLSFAIN